MRNFNMSQLKSKMRSIENQYKREVRKIERQFNNDLNKRISKSALLYVGVIIASVFINSPKILFFLFNNFTKTTKG